MSFTKGTCDDCAHEAESFCDTNCATCLKMTTDDNKYPMWEQGEGKSLEDCKYDPNLDILGIIAMIVDRVEQEDEDA